MSPPASWQSVTDSSSRPRRRRYLETSRNSVPPAARDHRARATLHNDRASDEFEAQKRAYADSADHRRADARRARAPAASFGMKLVVSSNSRTALRRRVRRRGRRSASISCSGSMQRRISRRAARTSSTRASALGAVARRDHVLRRFAQGRRARARVRPHVHRAASARSRTTTSAAGTPASPRSTTFTRSPSLSRRAPRPDSHRRCRRSSWRPGSAADSRI